MNTTTPRIDSSLPNGSPLPGAEWMQALATCAVQAQQLQLEALPVSYTHLTLPTIYSV